MDEKFNSSPVVIELKKMKINYIAMLVALFLLSCFMSSCKDEDVLDEHEFQNEITDVDNTTKNGRIHFTSIADLEFHVNEMKQNDDFSLPAKRFTRTKSSQNEQFISLRESLIKQKLNDFTDEKLNTISDNGLEYEPDDFYITDPYFLSILNSDREVKVGDKIYKYMSNGVLIGDEESIACFSINNEDDMFNPDEDYGGGGISDEVDFIPIDYNNGTEVMATSVGVSNGLTLKNGVVIPSSKIHEVKYKKKSGDSNWFQKSISGLWGLSVTAENNFDNRHRMKARMYSQDYVIYRAIGMTVRMQEKTLGIWWRKRAQEFRYGWTAIEVKYEFNDVVYKDPSVNPNIPPYITQTLPPVYIEKPFPYQNKEITLFNVPLVNYNVTTGDVNSVYNTAMNYIKNLKDSYVRNFSNKQYNAIGIYTQTEPKVLLHLYPQGEDMATDDGREVVRWDFTPFSGNFMASYTTNFAGSSNVSVNFSPSKTSIVRGEIYAAVKFDGQWRAARIYTGD